MSGDTNNNSNDAHVINSVGDLSPHNDNSVIDNRDL